MNRRELLAGVVGVYASLASNLPYPSSDAEVFRRWRSLEEIEDIAESLGVTPALVERQLNRALLKWRDEAREFVKQGI